MKCKLLTLYVLKDLLTDIITIVLKVGRVAIITRGRYAGKKVRSKAAVGLWMSNFERDMVGRDTDLVRRSSLFSQSTKEPSNIPFPTPLLPALSATLQKSPAAWARSESRSDQRSSHSLR